MELRMKLHHVCLQLTSYGAVNRLNKESEILRFKTPQSYCAKLLFHKIAKAPFPVVRSSTTEAKMKIFLCPFFLCASQSLLYLLYLLKNLENVSFYVVFFPPRFFDIFFLINV